MTDERLSRAVECNWDGCKNKTRSVSLRCQHHRRAARPGLVSQYKAADTHRLNVKANTVMRAVVDSNSPDHQRFIAIYRENQMMMASYPQLEVRSESDVRIQRAFTESGNTLTYDGGSYELAPGDRVVIDGVRLARSGSDLVVTPDDEQGSLVGAQESLMAARKDAWRTNYCRPGAVDGIAGEEYDDAAEAFAQIRLLQKTREGLTDTTEVGFIGRSDGVGLRLKDPATGLEELYVYRYGGIENSTPVGEPTADGGLLIGEGCTLDYEASYVRTRENGHTITVPVSDSLVERRADQLRVFEGAVDVIARYGYHDGDGLRIPVGWNSQNLLDGHDPALQRTER